ncbi:hypothetical protein NSA19_02950 [Actinomyces bowdenii]|uniref:hypothetical protein n=1 Tax=Actinomyces bowdenii TaxID=131109 RepID=UPI00214C7DBA|nr:hypothetical protein [Actinomyces bowdenii]MCR2051827.1 hypothetical protein [Actinomyces bowdenii]
MASTLYLVHFAVHNDDSFVARVTTACLLQNLPEPDKRFLIKVAHKVADRMSVDDQGVLDTDGIEDTDIEDAVAQVREETGGGRA